MSASKVLDEKSDFTLPFELIKDDADAAIESQRSFDLCNNLDYSESKSPTNKLARDLENSQYDIVTGTHNIASNVEHFDTLTNHTVSECEKTWKIGSLDFQAKNAAVGLSRTNRTKNGKRKTVPPMPKCRKLGSHYETEIVSHKLDFVEEENLSDQEESSEDDNLDNSLPYSIDRLDHRKERHQYVSDQLDPDVLHLLEMHLRKQQLVEIKEEREEELLDVHVNREKSRSESFKLFRNISPVLDMVLEEPELEHSGDTLDEGSKNPSDIDSDDSSNSNAVELGLMESLQNDLLSKSCKIDKHEIATILQTPSSDMSTRESKGKQKAALCESNDEIKCETIKNNEPNAPRGETADILQMDEILEPVDGNVTCGFSSDFPALENGHDLEVEPEGNTCHPWEGLAEESGPPKDAETEKAMAEEPDQSLSISSGIKDVNYEGVYDTEAYVTFTKTAPIESKDKTFTESESLRPEDTSKEQFHTVDGNLKKHDIGVPCLDGDMSLPSVSKSTDFPKQTDNFIIEEVSSEQHGDHKPLGGEDIGQTNLNEELKSVNKENAAEPSLPSSAEMSTLRLDLEEKLMSILDKAHAVDCRSSHLQAGAVLVWKESIELRNECKSLAKEAAELLSILKKQSAVQRQQRRQISQRTKTVGSLLNTTDSGPSKETLCLSTKNNSRSINKGEDQLKFLSKKYNFLREEAPEIMKELNVLQQDLKSLPGRQSKPMNILYNLLWGGLITGGALLFVWWSTKQLG